MHYYTDKACKECPDPLGPALNLTGVVVVLVFGCYLLYLFVTRPAAAFKTASRRFSTALQAMLNLGPSKIKTAVTFYQVINSLNKSFDLSPLAPDFSHLLNAFAWIDIEWSEIAYPKGCIASG